MQSFCGSIRLVRRHNINSSKIVGFISDRKFPVSSGSDLGTLISNHSVSNGGGAFNFVGTSTDYSKDWLFQSQPKFTSRSLLELMLSWALTWFSAINCPCSYSLEKMRSSGIIQRESFAIYLCFDCLTCVEECLEVLLSDMCPRRAQLLLRNTKSGIQTDLLISSNNGGVPWVAPIRRGARTSFFHPSAALPTLPSRCITTMHDSVKSSAEDTSAPVSNVSPRIKFKRPDKTAGHIMQILDKEAVEEVRKQREIPDIKPGYIIQLKVEAPQNKRRVSILKGIVIARRNAGLNTTFRLRRLVAGVGVESLFPLYSPNIKEIKVLDKNNVRRAKLYYLRDKMNPLRKQ